VIGGIWSIHDLRHRRSSNDADGDVERARVATAYKQAVRMLLRRVPRKPHFTPQEYEAAVGRAALSPAVKQEFAAITYLFMAAHYTAAPPQIDETQLQNCLRRLHHGLRRVEKVKEKR
jgi:hypothetical protein